MEKGYMNLLKFSVYYGPVPGPVLGFKMYEPD